ncbi:MAG: HIT family protein [Planctomycetes bacterium]|nr:HIT family protein [Planctomycetota bacterium]
MTPDPNCPFCKKLANVAGWPAGDVVWQFPHSVAVLGQWQYYTGYCVLVAREHATELSQLGPARAAYLDEMSRLAAAIETCFRPLKLNYELLGNQVPHLHWHIFPRSVTDHDRVRPVWFALDEADADPVEQRRLETGTVSRAEAVARLREQLKADGAPGEQGS